MRTLFFTLVAMLLMAPLAGATEVTPREAATPNVVSSHTAEPAGDVSGLELRKVPVEERKASSDAGAAQLGPRGGFWWTVGVIVVAVIIIAAVL